MKKNIFIFLAILLIILVASAVYFINPFANKIKAGLQVVTQDTSASLFINDQYLDKTPLINNNIMPGNYQLQIIPDDSSLATYELPITLTRGYLTVVVWMPGPTEDTSGGVIYELEPLPNKKQTEVSIISNPDQALVTFGEFEEKFTPVLLRDVEAKDYNFEISLVSFNSQKHTVAVIPGHRLNITVKLARNHLAGLAENADQVEEENITEATDSADATNSAKTNEFLTDQVIKIKSTNFFQEDEEVLRVRKEASLNSLAIGFVAANQSYEYSDEKEGWYFIKFTDPTDKQEKEGWVSEDYVKKNED